MPVNEQQPVVDELMTEWDALSPGGQAALGQDNMARVHVFLNDFEYKHTLRVTEAGEKAFLERLRKERQVVVYALRKHIETCATCFQAGLIH